MLEVYEFSLSYQATVWTSVVPLSNGLTIVWVASNKEPYVIPIISEDTNCSSVYPNDGVVAAFIAAFTCSTVTSPSTTEVKIVVDPVGTGTRCAEPINFPFNSGITNPIALAAPVELGTMLTAAARALLKSPFLWGYSWPTNSNSSTNYVFITLI